MMLGGWGKKGVDEWSPPPGTVPPPRCPPCRGGAHQELGVQRAGSTLLGVTVKVLSRMLRTGRALEAGGGTGGCLSIPNRWLLYLSVRSPPPTLRPYYLSRATLSAKLPTRRSG